jgi:hypothetical protein
VRSIQNVVRVLSKYIQEKYISDRHKGIWSNGQHLLPSGAAHMFDHPSVGAGGRGRGVNWLCGASGNDLASVGRDRPQTRWCSATQIR